MVARWSWFGALCVLSALLGGCAKSERGNATGGQGPSQPADEDTKWADHTQHLPFIIGYEKGMAEAKAQNKPVMLFVTTTWCHWCKKHAEENFNNGEIKDLLGNFVLVIVDGDTEPDVLATLKADQGFPHVIFQTSSGATLGEQLGYAPVEEFKKVIEAALAKADNA